MNQNLMEEAWEQFGASSPDEAQRSGGGRFKFSCTWSSCARCRRAKYFENLRLSESGRHIIPCEAKSRWKTHCDQIFTGYVWFGVLNAMCGCPDELDVDAYVVNVVNDIDVPAGGRILLFSNLLFNLLLFRKSYFA